MIFLFARAAVVLLQLPVQSFAPNSKSPSCVGFVATRVIKRSLNCLTFDLLHRRRNSHLKRSGATFTCRLGTLDFDPVTFLQRNLCNSFGQVVQFDLSTGSYDHSSLNCILEFTYIAVPLIRY